MVSIYVLNSKTDWRGEMKKWTHEQLQEHIRKNVTDYSAMVVVAALYQKLYGERPKIGMSGQQAEFVDSIINEIPPPLTKEN